MKKEKASEWLRILLIKGTEVKKRQVARGRGRGSQAMKNSFTNWLEERQKTYLYRNWRKSLKLIVKNRHFHWFLLKNDDMTWWEERSQHVICWVVRNDSRPLCVENRILVSKKVKPSRSSLRVVIRKCFFFMLEKSRPEWTYNWRQREFDKIVEFVRCLIAGEGLILLLVLLRCHSSCWICAK